MTSRTDYDACRYYAMLLPPLDFSRQRHAAAAAMLPYVYGDILLLRAIYMRAYAMRA